ncbi:hypothetical protein Asppvi_009349 [Aspergillus pseudoviridinutans]|uniref:AB hydrolase-1 domain-containing protein n=1 Tax=Aspergillus pseudoviridinutans TaxID=1517512 RepID=A0A9P3BFX5_9EURO|nr:uncharacterized protein Asppvi_009349 [Aspergillus pseudoviridinutans]GIJ90395.1 hypothetical protein Asppvi_009349 [Aspergillus pseudoviridinutans]
MGSPFGSASPRNVFKGARGPMFPLTTIRDDVRIHCMVLEKLGVRQVCMAVGHSMGGMHALEWAFQGDFVRSIVPIAATGAQSAWGIAWAEAQRQSIFSDKDYQDGWYSQRKPPIRGLRAAGMCALLTRRSKSAVERSRYSSFGTELASGNTSDNGSPSGKMLPVPSDTHKDSDSFARQFDANCYIALTRKMDTHDVGRGRSINESVQDALATIQQPTLVIGVTSDILHPIQEQRELAESIPNSRLCIIESSDGHDAVLSSAAPYLNKTILEFRKEVLPDIVDD